MATFSRLIYRFKAILTISAGFFAEIDMLILKFTQKLKGLRIAKTTLKYKNHFKGVGAFVGDKTVLKLTVLMAVYLCDYSKPLNCRL